MNSGIYCYENLINGKKYVGKSKNLNKRYSYHERNFRREECLRGENILLWRAIKKYGRENFKFYIVEECSPNLLNEKEKKYIIELKAHTSLGGYNFLWGGEVGTSGYIFSDETKRKISIANTGKKHTDATKQKLRDINIGKYDGNKNNFYGKKHSEATKQKMRENHHKLKGVIHPNYGKKLTTEEKDIIRNDNIGKKNKNASSKFHGVTLSIIQSKYKYWRSWFKWPEKLISIGNYKTELEAAKARDLYVINNEVDFPLNFPEILYSINIDLLFIIWNWLWNIAIYIKKLWRVE